MSELRSCPFCGEDASYCNAEGFQTDITTYWCTCDNKDCPNHGMVFAVDGWQSRPLEDALTAENARLREALRDLLSLVEEHGDKVIMAHATKLLGIKSALTPHCWRPSGYRRRKMSDTIKIDGDKFVEMQSEITRLRSLIQRMEEVGDFVLENYECAKKWICAMLGTEYTQDEVVIRWQELKKEMEG